MGVQELIMDHVHVGFTVKGANGRTSFWLANR